MSIDKNYVFVPGDLIVQTGACATVCYKQKARKCDARPGEILMFLRQKLGVFPMEQHYYFIHREEEVFLDGYLLRRDYTLLCQ